jgi:phosphopantothenoylcysteine decarboxylase/phosphopantothenate--cysteine ligase
MSHEPSRATVVLAVTGSIAAYKAPIVARLLKKRGVRVVPLLTKGALDFLGPETLSGLTGERTLIERTGHDGEKHVELGALADVVAVVPATADFLARLAQGRADDLVAATCLCARGRVLLAPAMHPRMWAHPATQRNVATLSEDGHTIVGPEDGEVASGDRGLGRMSEPEAIAAAILRELDVRDLEGVRVVVTAGPSVEDLDPVRFLGNRSTGKMGFAVAERAAARGATVTLVAGPVNLSTPPGVRRVDVRGALAMRAALHDALGPELDRADVLVMAAAVGDYRFRETHAEKLKRTGDALTLELVPNPDLLAEIGAMRVGSAPVLVGFAVETAGSDEALVALAHKKLTDKRVDFVVANRASDAFGRDDNRALLVSSSEVEGHGVLSKVDLADRILDRARTALGSGDRGSGPPSGARR